MEGLSPPPTECTCNEENETKREIEEKLDETVRVQDSHTPSPPCRSISKMTELPVSFALL